MLADLNEFALQKASKIFVKIASLIADHFVKLHLGQNRV
jgi:hypothetical protein